MGRLILCLFAAITAGCVGTQTMSQVSIEARDHAVMCIEAIHGPVSRPLPDPKIYYKLAANSDCIDEETPRALGCAGPDAIELVVEHYASERTRHGYLVLVHEYLHVLYYNYVDIHADFHHDDWELEFDRPECRGIPYRSLTEVYE